jgi:hypothetical protein
MCWYATERWSIPVKDYSLFPRHQAALARRCLPEPWWLAPYPVVVVVFVVLTLVLLGMGYPLPVAVGVPAVIDALVVASLITMARLVIALSPTTVSPVVVAG